jgi:hypothetical protein
MARMKKSFVCLLPALILLMASAVIGRADQFDQLANSPNIYWVPAPTPPPPAYAAGPPPPYYYGPPPPGYYYGPPPPPPVRFFFGFHFH